MTWACCYLYATWWWHVTPPARAWPLSCQRKVLSKHKAQEKSLLLCRPLHELNNASLPLLQLLTWWTHLWIGLQKSWHVPPYGARGSADEISATILAAQVSLQLPRMVLGSLLEARGLCWWSSGKRGDWRFRSQSWLSQSYEKMRMVHGDNKTGIRHGASLVGWPFPPACPALSIKPLGCWDYKLLEQSRTFKDVIEKSGLRRNVGPERIVISWHCSFISCGLWYFYPSLQAKVFLLRFSM